MKITLCGSIAFYDRMVEARNALEREGHIVKLPPNEVKNENGEMMPVMKYYEVRKKANDDDLWIWKRKEEAMRLHFDKVEWSDAVLVLNYDKNDIKGYVGANTLLEMGLAFHLKKKIFLLNNIPEIGYKEEILGMRPLVIDGDFGKLR